MTRVFVSATSGELLFTESLIPTDFGDAVRSVSIHNGRQQTSMSTIAAAGGHDVWITEAMTSPDADTEARAVNTRLNAAYDYYWGTFDWVGPDNLCAPVIGVVHYARADGSGNAFWSPRHGTIFVTDGFGANDIIQHEYTHAVLDHITLNPLEFALESGALEESLADTFAAFLDLDDGMWLVGEDRPPGPMRPMGFSRDMSNPIATNHPDHDDDRVTSVFTICPESSPVCDRDSTCVEGECRCHTKSCDWGGVHSNSQILNHAAYLMVHGGTHRLGGIPVAPIGESAAERIFFHAAHRLGTSTGFVEWAMMMMSSCHHLARTGFTLPGGGTISMLDCGNVNNAYAAVGVFLVDSDSDGWPDEWDNCDLVINPDQDGPDGDETGTACQSRPRPTEPEELPLPPPVEPTCPEDFVTTYRDDRIVEGTWPLTDIGPVMTSMATGREGVWGHYSQTCTYQNAANGGAVTIFELAWQPHDPADFGLVRDVMCLSSYRPLMLEVTSSSEQARVRWSQNWSIAGGQLDAVVAEQSTFAETILTPLEGLAFSCGAP